MDAALDAVVGLAAAVAAQQFELQVVERIEVGQAVADGVGERRVVGEQRIAPGDRQWSGDAERRGAVTCENALSPVSKG